MSPRLPAVCCAALPSGRPTSLTAAYSAKASAACCAEPPAEGRTELSEGLEEPEPLPGARRSTGRLGGERFAAAADALP